MLNSFLKNTAKTILNSPVCFPLKFHYSGLGSCLMYHRIVDDTNCSLFRSNNSISVHVNDFESQIKYLSVNYNCLDISTAISLLKDQILPKKTIIITFDDGYRDNLTLALPILEKYKVPAVIYIATGLIDGTAKPWWYEQEMILNHLNELRITWNGIHYHWPLHTSVQKHAAFIDINRISKTLTPTELDKIRSILLSSTDCPDFNYTGMFLSWDEIKILARSPLITIGGHTKNHSVLKQLNNDELNSELIESRSILEQKTGLKIKHFAYPYGDHGHAGLREFKAVQNLGFDSAVTTRMGHLFKEHHNRLHALPRIAIEYKDQMENFKWKLSGLAHLINNMGKRLGNTR